MDVAKLAAVISETDDAYIKILKRSLLGSQPDPFGVAQGIFHRTAGGMSQAQFEAWLAGTDEAKALNAHKPHPPADRWFPISTDLCGMRVPSIKPFGQTDVCFLPIYGAYNADVRADIRAALHALGYTHIVLDPRPKYPPLYPSAILTVDAYRAMLQEVVDDGLIPISFWLPDDQWPSAMALMEPFLADPGIRALSKLNATGWEINGWMTPEEMEVTARWLRSRLDPDALVFVHFTPGHAAGSGDGETEQHWWTRLTRENIIDGIFLQLEPRATVEEQADRIKDFTVRLTGGTNQWPTKQGDGSPLRVIVFEYDAYLQSRSLMTEAEGQARRRVFEVMPGVSGVADQP